jgi:hypothetical protein
MLSVLNPTFVYPVSRDISEHDVDVVSDLWNMDGREVYRGSRDTKFTHANVYWLYDEDLTRVGCVEHDLKNHAEFKLLWFQDSPFGTLLQEEWEIGDSIWVELPTNTVDRFMSEGWSTPGLFLENCLQGPLRIVTPAMILHRPDVYECKNCKRRSLRPIHTGCTRVPLDFPDKSKILFIDGDMTLHIPPPTSRVYEFFGFTMPQQHDDDSQPSPEPPALEDSTEPALEELQDEHPSEPPPTESAPEAPHPDPPEAPPEHPQTPPPQSSAETAEPERTRFATSRQIPARTRRHSG